MADASGRLSSRATTAVGAFILLVLSPVLSGCTAAGETASAGALPGPRGELVLEFDEGLSPEGATLTAPQNSGTAKLRVKVRTVGKGRLEKVAGRSGYAARTPAFATKGPVAAVAITVRPRSEDTLAPGDRAFRWGADVQLDAKGGTSATDDGANVIQRGLYRDASQVKLQLDKGVPSCRVKGSEGAAVVRAGRPLVPGLWTRVHCQLRHGRLTLSMSAPGQARPESWHTATPVGTVSFRRSVPVGIAAKVDGRGRIEATQSDQFNGALDNVFWDVS
ncbi:hypothetical protein [Nocardioides sp. 616]|uniref:hypothetical protein n=1 Tax=Nocardioides sp. 616 TaxID=2268090 RepID=UPI000CE4FC82|nr:hypothetical protein [Nocardioides sp. 616]